MSIPHGRKSRVVMADISLSGYLNSASSSGEREVQESTVFTDDPDKTYVGGLADATVTLEGFFDGSEGAIHDTLKDLLGQDAAVPLTYAMQGLAVGNPVGLADVHQVSYEVPTGVAQLVQLSIEGQATGGIDHGVSLADLSSRTANDDESSVDNSSSTSNGGVAHLHVTAASGTTPTLDVTVQESTDDSTWADLATFTQATDVTSERVEVTGTVERYLRAEYEVGGTDPDFTLSVAFARR